MKRRLIYTLLLLAVIPCAAWADYDPTAYYTEEGTEKTSNSAFETQAPATITFKANPTDTTGLNLQGLVWKFYRENSQEPYLVRYEEETTFEFTESGSHNIKLFATYRQQLPDGNGGLAWRDTTIQEGSIRVTIKTSLLEMPNAFSPNGDGTNDIYGAKSTHRSIVEFHAYIFNRWGQKLYEWTDINGGWDGTYNGHPVKAGVYFVLVKARGADGYEYKIKRDVNLLRDFTEDTGTGTNP